VRAKVNVDMGRGRRWPLICALAVLACWFAAPSASADTINITQFDRTVSGDAGPAFTGTVTVDLLRNTVTTTGVPLREQVDSCTATGVSGGSTWQCSFAMHAFGQIGDQIEVNYSGTGAPEPQVTVGFGAFAPTATDTVTVPAFDLDGDFGISSDGSYLTGGCEFCDSWTVNDGGTTLTPVSDRVNFPTDVSNTTPVTITGIYDNGSGTDVNYTVNAPLLTPLTANDVASGTHVDEDDRQAPFCVFYLDTSEVVCNYLDPGSYTLTHVRAGSTLGAQVLTVPGQTGEAFQPWPRRR